jgi:hypothetical protein
MTMDDLVDGVGRDFRGGIRRLEFPELGRDALQPLLELRGGTRVQRGEPADHAGLALRDREVGVGDDEERRADHGK